MTTVEGYYSGRAGGEVTVREGNETRVLEARWSDELERRPFTWGRDQTGAAQLAFALLTDALANEVTAKRFYERFSHRVVANFPERWTITRTRILGYVRMMKLQESGG